MKRCYRFHPGEYAIGENEQFYGRMAQRGWLLDKRGAYLSRFRKGEPQQRKYRIELSSPHFLDDDQSLPEEQIQLYEECGWKLTAENGLVHVFSASEGSDAPEFYSDPRQQAATFRALKRSYWVGWIVAFMILGFHAAMLFGLSSVSSFQTLQRFAADFVVGWVEETATVLFYAVFVLLAVYEMLYGTIRTMLLCRRLKRGKPLDHSPRRHIVYQIITAAPIFS